MYRVNKYSTSIRKKGRDHAVIIDGNNLLCVGYDTFDKSVREDGFHIGASKLFAKRIKNIILNFKPKFIGIMFDTPKRSIFRTTLLPQYKASRSRTPSTLRFQFSLAKEITSAFRIPYFSKDGVEADDLIASYALHYYNNDCDVTVVSHDKDLLQLIRAPSDPAEVMDLPEIKVYLPASRRYMRREHVLKRFGVEPHILPDYLALVGDESDNIPGIPGMTSCCAAALLQKFGSLNGILRNSRGIPDKNVQLHVERSISQLEISLRVARLHVVPLPKELSLYSLPTYDEVHSKLYTIIGKEGREILRNYHS